jgi:hypothetical protein
MSASLDINIASNHQHPSSHPPLPQSIINDASSHCLLPYRYKPGVFKISGYQPMLAETRALLDRGWQGDCVVVSKLSGHVYDVCKDQVEAGK